MPKRSGSRSSRSERKAGRKRAEQAREHGLPAPRQPVLRVRASTPEPTSHAEREDRSSDAPPAPAAKRVGVPTLAKVLGGALVILLGVYLLSRWRDDTLTETRPAPEPVAAAPQPSATSLPEAPVEPVPEAASTAAVSAAATPVPASAPSLAPKKPARLVKPSGPAQISTVAPAADPVAPVAAPPADSSP